MDKPGQIERITQNRVVKLFSEELGYEYLGDWEERENNSNIETELLEKFLLRKGYQSNLIKRAIDKLKVTADNFREDLYLTNKEVYELLRYGVKIKADVSENYETVHVIDWKNFKDNDFAIAEEVTVRGVHDKRPDIVIYVNGIALGIIELKRSTKDLAEGIRQNLTNQQDEFIKPFFSTVQFLFAGNDTQGLRNGTIKTQEKYYLKWKEDVEDISRNPLDKYLIKMCSKERFLELIKDFVLFDGGVKKLPRVHQYFGIKEAQKFVNNYEGGIIWHTQGSGKSIVMVILAKWILENNPNARIAIVTDRDELDKQIERVFRDADEAIYRTRSGKDLLLQLSQTSPRLICSLIHKFGRREVENFDQFIQELESEPVNVFGELFIFVDECHRTQSGKLHRTMKAILPNAVFIGFTGTPLLKKDKQTSLEVFGKYIHTYKFNEGVEDKVILDLVYEARDIDQQITSEAKVDQWFEAKTAGLNDFQKAEIKKKWGTMQKVLSCRSRMEKIVNDIVLDFSSKRRLLRDTGNAILVANTMFEACKYYDLFQKTELKGRCVVVISYDPNANDIKNEETGANTETDRQFMYNLYKKILKDVNPDYGRSKTECYEDWAKKKFREEPARMKLLIVVYKLLTGFDAPACTYLYIDKKMQDHGLFQAICRVNRLDGYEKDYGYIVDYKDLFQQVQDSVQVYTSDLDYDEFEKEDIDILLKNRLKTGKERLDDSLEEIFILCEPVPSPKEQMDYIRYFCGNPEIEEDLKETEPQRTELYKKTVALIRAYANIAGEMQSAGYSEEEIESIKKEIKFYIGLRDEIKNASGETIDLKTYEADMRHLLDTYIKADESEVISPFGEMSLLDIVERVGLAEALNTLPKKMKGNKEAVAETIENNVRKKIIKEFLIDPAFFENMSTLLNEIIKKRKEQAVSYEEYLKRIGELISQVNKGRKDDTPEELKTKAQRVLYNNLAENPELALNLDRMIRKVKRDSWRGNKAKENEIKQGIYEVLASREPDESDRVAESTRSYGQHLIDEVERLFKIIEKQSEY